jgi:hypothetical protein
MDYPACRAKGWAIGSGPIESARMTVIGKRMKNEGMRWGEDGADEMCHLRALFASGEIGVRDRRTCCFRGRVGPVSSTGGTISLVCIFRSTGRGHTHDRPRV